MKPAKSKFLYHLNRDTVEYDRSTIESFNTSLFNTYTLLNNQQYPECLNKLYQLLKNQKQSCPEDIWYSCMISYQISMVMIKLENYKESIRNSQDLCQQLEKYSKSETNKSDKILVNSCKSLVCKCISQQIVASLMSSSGKGISEYVSKLKASLQALENSLRPKIVQQCSLVLFGNEDLDLSTNKCEPKNSYQSQLLGMYSMVNEDYQEARDYIIKSLKLQESSSVKGRILGMIYLLHINQKLGKDISKQKQQISAIILKQKLGDININKQLKNIKQIRSLIVMLSSYLKQQNLEIVDVDRYRYSLGLNLVRILKHLMMKREEVIEKLIKKNSKQLQEELMRIESKIECLKQLEYEMKNPVESNKVLNVLKNYKFVWESNRKVEDRMWRLMRIADARVTSDAFGKLYEYNQCMKSLKK